MKKKERIDIITSHWKDEDFQEIREAFKDYLLYGGINMGDEYIQKITYLLGLSFVTDHEGYDAWWELDELELCEYIKF